MKTETTSSDFLYFTKVVNKWIKNLGLLFWRTDIEHQDYEDGGARAWYMAMIQERVAGIYLAKDWDEDEVTQNRVGRAGFHEVFHLLLAKIEGMLADRGYDDETIATALHEVIYSWENYFFKEDENDKTMDKGDGTGPGSKKSSTNKTKQGHLRKRTVLKGM